MTRLSAEGSVARVVSWCSGPRRRVLPEGRRLSDDVWLKRHRGLTILLWLHVPVLLAYGLVRGYGIADTGIECLALVGPGLISLQTRLSRNVRSASTALGLVVGASIFVHLSGGLIEAHFQFFVVLALLTLYQAWLPFLLALTYTVIEHGLLGVLDPRAVYDEPAAIAHPWLFAGIHGGFVLAASFGNLLAWRLTEEEGLRDGLTGAANRTYLLDWLSKTLAGRGRTNTAVAFIDLDNFKDANDGFGHEVGDMLLRAICERLRGTLRANDLLARVGGDEFAVVLGGLSNRGEGRAAAERMLQVLRAPFALGDISYPVSASLGLAFSEDEHGSAAELLRNADLAMYEAKRAGGERVREFEPVLHTIALRRTELAAELRAALVEAQFLLHYQPIFDLASGEMVGTEALIRWNHPTRGLVPPAEFIPAAEQSGQIVELGAWVLRTACAQTAAWNAARLDQGPLTVSVNLSPRQLTEMSVVPLVVKALAETGLSPAALWLEITESSFIRDFDATLTTLKELKAVGVGLALDDFGTGYSSLSYLQRLPVDSVKIDRSFIMGLDDDSPDIRIVRAIIDLARVLGITATAEGIETEEQLRSLRGMRAERGQGYLLGRPQPAELIPEIVQRADAARRQVRRAS